VLLHDRIQPLTRWRRSSASTPPTFTFLIGELGTRARVLALRIANLHARRPDANVGSKGVPIPPPRSVVGRHLPTACARDC